VPGSEGALEQLPDDDGARELILALLPANHETEGVPNAL
jgi:hypothetical protein